MASMLSINHQSGSKWVGSGLPVTRPEFKAIQFLAVTFIEVPLAKDSIDSR